jgi:Protein of unknown function (DUF3107)
VNGSRAGAAPAVGSGSAIAEERVSVEIRIGIVNSARELTFESSQSSSEIEKSVSDALESGAKFIRLLDEAGKVYVVPTATLAYIEVGSEKTRRVGFVA